MAPFVDQENPTNIKFAGKYQLGYNQDAGATEYPEAEELRAGTSLAV